jgi:hypothetical protein
MGGAEEDSLAAGSALARPRAFFTFRFAALVLIIKKKSGLSRKKFVRLGWQVPSWALPTHLPTKHHPIQSRNAFSRIESLISDPGRGCTRFGTL